jgi:hypothetical protein
VGHRFYRFLTLFLAFAFASNISRRMDVMVCILVVYLLQAFLRYTYADDYTLGTPARYSRGRIFPSSGTGPMESLRLACDPFGALDHDGPVAVSTP